MRRGTGLNDSEREMWVNNDEGLYNWFRSSRLSMREFLRQNRAEIDAAITGVLVQKEPSPRMSRRELELYRAKHWTTSMNPARRRRKLSSPPWGFSVIGKAHGSRIAANLSQASAPILFEAGEPGEETWGWSPFQTADARHYASQALALMRKWLPGHFGV